jgi:hypothetical protein
MAGRTNEGVAMHALASLPLCAVDKTAQTAAAALAAMAGMAACTDGCTGGTCSNGPARTFILDIILAATAPAVANPCLNFASGTAADTSGAAGDAAAARAATTALASTVVVSKGPSAGSDVQGMYGYFVPRTYTKEELRKVDLQLQQFTNVDCWLIGIFGITIHQNDGTHLDGRINIAGMQSGTGSITVLLLAHCNCTTSAIGFTAS